MKDATLLQLIMGLFSIIVFLYRAVVLMIPMIQEGIKERQYGKIMNGLTMLV